jgi:hypothetical protein
MYKKQKVVFEELDHSIPVVHTDLWREVPIKADKVGQKWTIPFESTQTGGKLACECARVFAQMV